MFARLNNVNWEEATQKLAAFANYHAFRRYRWKPLDTINGLSPEDIVFAAISSLYAGDRNCKEDQDILLCVQRIIESIMNNQYHKKSAKAEKEGLYKSDGSENEMEYAGDGSRSPEEFAAAKEDLALREQELDRLIANDKDIEQYVDALLSVPNLDDDTDYIAQKLNVGRKDVYRIRRKLRRKRESGES